MLDHLCLPVILMVAVTIASPPDFVEKEYVSVEIQHRRCQPVCLTATFSQMGLVRCYKFRKPEIGSLPGECWSLPLVRWVRVFRRDLQGSEDAALRLGNTRQRPTNSGWWGRTMPLVRGILVSATAGDCAGKMAGQVVTTRQSGSRVLPN